MRLRGATSPRCPARSPLPRAPAQPPARRPKQRRAARGSHALCDATTHRQTERHVGAPCGAQCGAPHGACGVLPPASRQPRLALQPPTPRRTRASRDAPERERAACGLAYGGEARAHACLQPASQPAARRLAPPLRPQRGGGSGSVCAGGGQCRRCWCRGRRGATRRCGGVHTLMTRAVLLSRVHVKMRALGATGAAAALPADGITGIAPFLAVFFVWGPLICAAS